MVFCLGPIEPCNKHYMRGWSMGFDVNEAERKHTRYSFHGTETKLLVSSSKP